MKIKEDSAEFQERKAHFEKQLEKFAERLADWKERHPHTPPPLHVDEDGMVHWVNRKLRRKLGK